MVNNYLFQAKVMHKRHFPCVNFFCYNSSYLIFPLFNKEAIKNTILSINKWNVFSFYDKDHGTRKKDSNTRQWAMEKLLEIGIKEGEISEIVLLTHPRCFSFVFNPVSFYFCLNGNSEVITIIVEVNNTFSQTHSYIIHEKDFKPIQKNKVYKTTKEFFVSPFMKREGEYHFRFSYGEEKIAIFIDYFKDGKLMLETSLIGKRTALTVKSLIGKLFTTFKTMLLILYQGFKLAFIKSLKFRRPTELLPNNITYNKL